MVQPRTDWYDCCSRQARLRKLPPPYLIRSFKISSDIHKAVAKRKVKKIHEIKNFSGELDENNYRHHLEALLRIDEAYWAIIYRRYDLLDHSLKKEYFQENGVSKLRYYGIKIEGLSHSRSPLVPNDFVLLGEPSSNKWMVSLVQSIEDGYIKLPLAHFAALNDLFEKKLEILFFPGGQTYNYFDKALERAEKDPMVKSVIFETRSWAISAKEKIPIETNNQVLEERLNKLNEYEGRVVLSILAAECRPKPYIVSGPSRTRKTLTLVEAVAQIYARASKAKILFCSHSDKCAFQIVTKLKQTNLIPFADIQSFVASDNTDDIGSSRILVTTNMNSARLMGEFVFDYVFIDEAGYAHEPETLLPICCLKEDGCLVLAGDPKQMGPVVKCKRAAKHGLGRSMLERILKFKVYQKDPETNKYDSKYITELLPSYRHVSSISDRLFYDNEPACRDETPTSLVEMINLNGPVQFCYVDGTESQTSNSTS